MEDQSIYTNSRPQGGISENLQRFIDAMVEEIALEGKPFDTQKKYLKKYSENEGLDYDKLEADIITFIEILDSLKTAFSKLQVKLAEEKGRECYISEEMVKKLVNNSSPSNPPKIKEPEPIVNSGDREVETGGIGSHRSDGTRKVWPWIVAAGVGLIVVIAMLSKPKRYQYDEVQEVQVDTVQQIIDSVEMLLKQSNELYQKGSKNIKMYDLRSYEKWLPTLDSASNVFWETHWLLCRHGDILPKDVRDSLSDKNESQWKEGLRFVNDLYNKETGGESISIVPSAKEEGKQRIELIEKCGLLYPE